MIYLDHRARIRAMSPAAGIARKETFLIADQLRRVYDGPSWLGPNLRELLSGVSAERAKQRPLSKAHSIWEITLHITTWLRVALERLSASEICDPTTEEDWPSVSGTWPEACTQLEAAVKALEQAILAFPSDRLHRPAPASEPQTYYVLLHGIVQHCAYHAGQIALLAK